MLAASLVVYLIVLAAIAWVARRRIHDETDFLVAARQLGVPLAAATLFATWFGAGTLLVTADEIRAQGTRAAALDPIGPGLCLLGVGLFLAGPLWRRQLLTLPDFFRERFGPHAEWWCGVLLVPGYLGWIAAQMMALAGVLELFFGLPPAVGLPLVAAVGTAYTFVGGMWSVALTDAVQGGLLLLGLVLLSWATLDALGGGAGSAAGFGRLAAENPPDILAFVPLDALEPFVAWVGLLAAGSLGTLPSQELWQRVFAARSERVARRACLLAGGAYLTFGLAPILLGLSARLLAPEGERSVLPLLAELLLHPALGVVLLLALVSAVLSTLDSAILAPSSVLAQNVLASWRPGRGTALARNQLAVVGVGVASLGVAALGEDAFSLLEASYELTLVALLVPLVLGVYGSRADERAALLAMTSGTSLWFVHMALGQSWFGGDALGVPLPLGLGCATVSLLAYLAASRSNRNAN